MKKGFFRVTVFFLATHILCSPQTAQADSARITPNRNPVSAAAAADVFQGAAADTIKILYDLSAKTGDDGKTYIPVDMGYGVAWADRNTGADNTNEPGSYFRWGDPDATNYSIGEKYRTWSKICAANSDFADEYDMAKGNMGNRWRMPSKSEYTDLLNNTTVTDNHTFTSKTDNSKSILFPATGNYYTTIHMDADYQYYWTKTYGKTIGSQYCVYCLVRTGNNTYKVAYTDVSNGNIGSNRGIACRAIYVPPFTPCTLTVSVDGYLYRYLCEPGQEVTVTAHATAENHIFDRWTEDGNTRATRTFTVTNDISYTATFKEKPAETHIVLNEDGDDAHYDDFAAYDGLTAATVTLNRRFIQGYWSTLCLPFDVSGGTLCTLGLTGRVFEFRHATGNANADGDGVTLYFAQAKKMEAGKGYIVNANAKLAAKTQFIFPNVTIDVTNDRVKPLNGTDKYDELAEYTGYNDGTETIQLVGTLRKGQLKGSAGDNTYMGLKDNTIYYPNISTGNIILAYRGVFRSTLPMNIRRVRIVAEGEEMTEMTVTDDGLKESAKTRKIIRNAALYIEREGITYNAYGQRIN